jgi:tRNA(Ile)-lysidine synthase
MVMLHLFQQIKWPIAIAHCNFQLRAEASENDAAFVKKMCLDSNIRFFYKAFDTQQYATAYGISTQMAARELRYAWFAEICQIHDYQGVAVAQHLNDAAETALLNWVRGTGLRGLGGIRTTSPFLLTPPDRAGEVKNGGVMRPLLFASRTEIHAYALDHQLVWREDSSNASDYYDRNYIRHHIVPRMEELNPNWLNTTARTLSRLRETEDNFQFLWQRYLDLPTVLGEVACTLEKKKISQLPAARQVLHEVLQHYGFHEDQAQQVAEHLSESGLILHSASGWRLMVEREVIRIVRQEAEQTLNPISIERNDLIVTLPDESRLLLMHTQDETTFPDGKSAIVVDAQQLNFPLRLRRWETGDIFQPFGMQGKSQSLQDFFTNIKLSRLEKEKVWLLVNSSGEIVWVVGHRLDHRFRVQAQTTQRMHIAWLSQHIFR